MVRSLFQYLYYRLVKFYKNTFRIEDSPGFLIQSCYEWGSQVMMAVVCFYLLTIETLLLWLMGIKMKITFVLVTMLPFFFLHVFSENIFGDEKERFKELENKYQDDKLSWLKGILVFLFIVLSLVSFMMALHFCK